MKIAAQNSLFLFLVLLCLSCISCAALSREPSVEYPHVRPSLLDERRLQRIQRDSEVAISVMPLGDSITFGNSSGVARREFQVSYRKALWEKLVATGYSIDFVGSQIAGESIPEFDPQHEGHSGWQVNEISANIFNWLNNSPADVVLLHIGTNDITGGDEDPNEVAYILDEIDRYSTEVWVIIARIINRIHHVCPTSASSIFNETTTIFNDTVEAIALDRVLEGDKIIIVDMECGAGIDYERHPYGDMWDEIHPYETGYEKMAEVWFSGLKEILPSSTNSQ